MVASQRQAMKIKNWQYKKICFNLYLKILTFHLWLSSIFRRFELEGWNWAHFLHLLKLFPDLSNFLKIDLLGVENDLLGVAHTWCTPFSESRLEWPLSESGFSGKSSEIPEFRNQVLLKSSEIPEFRNNLVIFFLIILKSDKPVISLQSGNMCFLKRVYSNEKSLSPFTYSAMVILDGMSLTRREEIDLYRQWWESVPWCPMS
jgi:hypothetical protein